MIGLQLAFLAAYVVAALTVGSCGVIINEWIVSRRDR